MTNNSLIEKLGIVYKWFLKECPASPESGEVVDSGARHAFEALCEAMESSTQRPGIPSGDSANMGDSSAVHHGESRDSSGNTILEESPASDICIFCDKPRSKCERQSSEISVITTEEQLGFLTEDILRMLADHVHDCKTPLRTKLCLLIRPYMAQPTKPVMVSLEKCALAYCQADEDFDMNTYREKKPHERGIEMAKAVLDAAGVKYVD